MTEVDVYEVDQDSWTAAAPMPNAHCSCAYTMFNTKLHIAGGLTSSGPTGAVEVLNSNK